MVGLIVCMIDDFLFVLCVFFVLDLCDLWYVVVLFDGCEVLKCVVLCVCLCGLEVVFEVEVVLCDVVCWLVDVGWIVDEIDDMLLMCEVVLL